MNLIVQLIDELDALGKTRDDAWQVPLVEGELLHQIALATRARVIVEVGTSYGFSALCWARALQVTGGHLHTIDRDPKKFESSKQTFARAGVAELITNYLGDAANILPNMPEGIDVAFIDADKPAVPQHFELLWPKLKVGGSLLIDNALTHREQLGPFIAKIRARADARSTEIAIGNGLEWVIKL